MYQNKTAPAPTGTALHRYQKMIPTIQKYCIIFGGSLQAEHTFRLAVIFIPIFKDSISMSINNMGINAISPKEQKP